MTTNVKEVLIEAKALISDEKNWIKGYPYLIDIINGRECFCTTGALANCVAKRIEPRSDEQRLKLYSEARLALIGTKKFKASGIELLHSFNDNINTTHSDIMEMFDEAIKGQGE